MSGRQPGPLPGCSDRRSSDSNTVITWDEQRRNKKRGEEMGPLAYNELRTSGKSIFKG